jgi:agmatinase
MHHRDLSELPVHDAGDLELPGSNLSANLERIEHTARQFLQAGQRFLALGGEHLVTLPLVRAVHQFYPELVVVHWDAHADLRDEFLGDKLSHATVMRRVGELLPPRHLFQFGMRSATADEVRWAKQHSHWYPYEVLQPLSRVLPELRDRPVYVTIDVDVIDPAFLPGTGTPEPGGIAPGEVFSALTLLGELTVVAMDMVEASPLQDVSQRTAILVAKMVREALTAHYRAEQ